MFVYWVTSTALHFQSLHSLEKRKRPLRLSSRRRLSFLPKNDENNGRYNLSFWLLQILRKKENASRVVKKRSLKIVTNTHSYRERHLQANATTTVTAGFFPPSLFVKESPRFSSNKVHSLLRTVHSLHIVNDGRWRWFSELESAMKILPVFVQFTNHATPDIYYLRLTHRLC